MSLPWCVLIKPEIEGVARGGMLTAAQWPASRAITISFLDDKYGLRTRVQEVAEQWLSRTGAELKFQWRVDTTRTDLRISFVRKGSWSLLGAQALAQPDVAEPTMNLGWLNAQSSEDDLRKVVLHEFGHALGLIHEHSSPEAQIPWNRAAVIAALSGPPNNWPVAQIEHNVFSGYDRNDVRTTPFDEHSIMLYPISKAWTVGGYETAANTDLSDQDIALIRRIYGRP